MKKVVGRVVPVASLWVKWGTYTIGGLRERGCRNRGSARAPAESVIERLRLNETLKCRLLIWLPSSTGYLQVSGRACVPTEKCKLGR